MKTIKVKTYKFEELGKEAQEFAIEKYREKMEFDLDFFAENCQEQIKEAGFIEMSRDGKPELRYSLSDCQGDGLSFTIKNLDVPAFIRANKLKTRFMALLKAYEDLGLFAEISLNDHRNYCHARSVSVFVDCQINDKLSAEADKLKEVIDQVRLDLCRKLEKQGYADIEDQQSDESIKDFFIANGYAFLIDGKRSFYL